MSTPSLDQNACREALQLIADPIAIVLLINLSKGSIRFNDLKRISGANAVTLTKRLKSLEQAGLLVRVEQTTSKQSVAYSLSDMGRICLPIVDAVSEVAVVLQKRM